MCAGMGSRVKARTTGQGVRGMRRGKGQICFFLGLTRQTQIKGRGEKKKKNGKGNSITTIVGRGSNSGSRGDRFAVFQRSESSQMFQVWGTYNQSCACLWLAMGMEEGEKNQGEFAFDNKARQFGRDLLILGGERWKKEPYANSFTPYSL